MANTMSAKKALRQSKRNAEHNLFWRSKVKSVLKNIKAQLANSNADVAIIKKEHSLFYKVIDKATKEGAFDRNRARRLKSKISKEIAKYENPAKPVQKEKASSKSAKPAARSSTRSTAKSTKSVAETK